MSWEKVLKEETNVPYELQMDDAEESREKALDVLGECLNNIERWVSQDYSPYRSEQRVNPTERPAKYGSASGKLEQEETHELIFKIRNMIQEHIVSNT
tara:strand:+ start:1777 stop:2070 length:294 start_codon:yes stop_codon:yes gene_type:complete